MFLLFLSIILVALCVFLLSFNIIFRKNGKFPEKEVGHNKKMRELGLTCAKSDERALWGKECSGCSSCSTCGSSKI